MRTSTHFGMNIEAKESLTSTAKGGQSEDSQNDCDIVCASHSSRLSYYLISYSLTSMAKLYPASELEVLVSAAHSLLG